jgi:hypothetical protein
MTVVVVTARLQTNSDWANSMHCTGWAKPCWILRSVSRVRISSMLLSAATIENKELWYSFKKKHKEICRRYCIEKYHQNVDVAPASDYSLTARAESDRAVDFCTGPSFKHLMVTKSRTLDRVMIVWLWLWLVVFQKCPMWKSCENHGWKHCQGRGSWSPPAGPERGQTFDGPIFTENLDAIVGWPVT